MTFDQYINNPMGIKNSVISNRQMYMEHYTEKLDKIMLRENGKVDYWIYKNTTDYFVYIKIPSEVIENFYYDVLIRFAPQKGKNLSVEQVLDNYNVYFFSNDPSFVFTFTHAFIKNDMFITDMKSKMSKDAIKGIAKERNPKDEIGYVKSLYFAYLIMKRKGLFKKVLYLSAPIYNVDLLKGSIIHADDKIRSRQEEQKNADAKSKKRKNSIRFDNASMRASSQYSIKHTGVIGKTKQTGSSKSPFSTSFTKMTKKTKRV